MTAKNDDFVYVDTRTYQTTLVTVLIGVLARMCQAHIVTNFVHLKTRVSTVFTFVRTEPMINICIC